MSEPPALTQTEDAERAADEAALFFKICKGQAEPDPTMVASGRAARDAGKQFHEGPQPFDTSAALSWRIGWNERALELDNGR